MVLSTRTLTVLTSEIENILLWLRLVRVLLWLSTELLVAEATKVLIIHRFSLPSLIRRVLL
jgi:hypothetical protein